MAYLEYRPNQTLFQYSSIDGLFGILRSKRLRLSDLASANDPRELKLGYEKVMQALEAVLRDEYQGAKGALLSRLVERLIGYYQGAQVFCGCFSMAADELPMWATYGANYSGLAIGFRPAALLSLPGRVQKVRYLDPSKEDGEFKALALDIAAQVDIHQRSRSPEPWISAGVDAITATTALKHTTWAYEKEIRLIYVQRRERPQGLADQIPTGSMSNDQVIYWREPLERTVGSRTIKYVEFPFGRIRGGKFDPARSLKTIIIGPNCPLSEADVGTALKEQGFDGCIVRRSECQIR
jgi:hypothetical protein